MKEGILPDRLFCEPGDELLKTRGHRQIFDLSLQELSEVIRSIVHRQISVIQAAEAGAIYTRAEAAERCRMSLGTFASALKKTGFKASKVDRKYFFTEMDLVEILNKLKT